MHRKSQQSQSYLTWNKEYYTKGNFDKCGKPAKILKKWINFMCTDFICILIIRFYKNKRVYKKMFYNLKKNEYLDKNKLNVWNLTSGNKNID